MSILCIHGQAALTPVTEADLLHNTYNILGHLSSLFDETIRGAEYPSAHSDSLFVEWTSTPEQVALVKSAPIWATIYDNWLYAEKGIHPKKLRRCTLELGHLVTLHRLIGLGDLILMHDGSFDCGSVATHEALIKLMYKFIARAKLDKLDTEYYAEFLEMNIEEYFPQALEYGKLSTIEYALLAGFSHIGAVRNEASGKNSTLKVTKEGNSLAISVEEARKRIPRKRKFIPTEGIDYEHHD
ncbi:hypothetical protein BCU83_04165 [Vibrio breoganii]|uniref:hypothetical protein n=1 Tax=Vibrio breoganii TaxID=553239 RepID=UPI000C82FE7F|nr:hypothetical protein [Vibrio breoganii]PMG86413.1 hypothetical protein BCU83_04165 [Vibrio breoganii]